MKMICAILQDDDTRGLLDKLAERGLRATKVSSTGGFLRNGNSTILIGVEDGQVSGVLDILRATCRTRRQVIDVPEDSLPESIRVILPLPTEVEVGGANVFVWDIEDYIKV
jgi:uncharacterized protein YaaQ